MKKIQKIILGVALLAGFLALPAVVPSGSANATHTPAHRIQSSVNQVDPQSGGGRSLQASITIVVNILLFVVGAVSVIIIVIGGLRYVLSSGDQNAITGAKNTILYAVIGLIVAILGYAIVNFVVTQFI
jgi:hypothetical protein